MKLFSQKPSAAFVHCYNINPVMLRNGSRMKTNRRSRPVKKNRPVKDIYIIYNGRIAYRSRQEVRPRVIYNVCYATDDVQRMMYII